MQLLRDNLTLWAHASADPPADPAHAQAHRLALEALPHELPREPEAQKTEDTEAAQTK